MHLEIIHTTVVEELHHYSLPELARSCGVSEAELGEFALAAEVPAEGAPSFVPLLVRHRRVGPGDAPYSSMRALYPAPLRCPGAPGIGPPRTGRLPRFAGIGTENPGRRRGTRD